MRSSDAKNIVQAWRKGETRPMETDLGMKVMGVKTVSDSGGRPVYHVVALTDDGRLAKGFVIVAGEDEAEPIVAFSSGAQFDPNGPLAILLDRHMPKLVGRLREARPREALFRAGAAAAKSKWASLSRRQGTAGAPPASSSAPLTPSDIRVAPLLQSVWNQLTSNNFVNGPACYNYYTPPYAAGTDTNYYCGCVATCTAQLMRYWQYPTTAVGTGSFSISVNNVAKKATLLGGDGKGGPYVWSNMPLTPASGVTLTQQRQIGVLIHDVALVAQTDFTPTGSSGYLSDAVAALVTTFHYGNAVDVYTDSSDPQTMSTPLLISMLTPNLDAGYPALIAVIGDSGSGHALVCDGYGYNNGTLYHHLNLGWGGDGNAWYALPTITTDVDNFHVVDECSFNIFPTGGGEIVSGRVTDAAGDPLPGAQISAARTGGGTYTASTNASGIYALTHVPASSTYAISVSATGYTFANRTVTTGTSSSGVLNLPGYINGTVGSQSNIDFTGASFPPPFFAGAASLGSGVYYLAFPNGNIFGYYSYPSFPYLYHFDMGYLYFIDANDGKGGAFFYDFTSGHFLYTGPSYPFPYMYDFTLQTVLYYYPDTKNPGHYTSNPRYFYNYATQQVITQ